MVVFQTTQLFSQVVNTGVADTTTGEQIGELTIGGFVDTYYGYITNSNNSYFVSSSRSNEVNVNLAFIDFRYHHKRVRARLAPAFGTYINSNYINEPGVLKNLLEANVGLKLFKGKDIWLDAGVLGSPYTNESAVSKDHFMYTRSLSAEYVPYYLSGAKLSVPMGSKFNAYLYFLNGWQQIQDFNKGKSIGTQLEFRPNNNHLFNWNAYIGDERNVFAPQNRMRYFSDVYWIYNPGKKLAITSCVYYGIQQVTDSLNKLSNNTWFQANLIAKYNFTESTNISGRFEYFSDPRSVQITPITGVSGFNTFSGSLGLNVTVMNHAMFRLEGRHFFSKDKIYATEKLAPTNNSTWLVSNLTIWF